MKPHVIYLNFYILTSLIHSYSCLYTKHLVIQLNGNETTAQQVATTHSLKLKRKIFTVDNFYHYKLLHDQDGPLQPHYLSNMKNDSRIMWVKQQIKRTRVIRGMKLRHKTTTKHQLRAQQLNSQFINFNDPYYPDQWYLHNEGQTGSYPGNDLNIVPAWKAGFTGRGVTVSVLDDGIQHTNLDIEKNYDPSVSYDFVDMEDEDHDPTPDLNGDNGHGTYCAGIIAAVANNSICGVGIAYNANIGGSRLMDGKVTDLQEALALTYGLKKVDIFSASWGPQDDGKHMSGPGRLTSKALEIGIQKGRQGKGVIFVWAVGNGGAKKDNCNMDGYVTSIYTVAISALTDKGLSAYYSEPCASAIASTFVGGLHRPAKINLNSIHDDMKAVKIVVPELDGRCTDDFQGTSAAAPLAAGVIALVIEANPSLTWRDVQHLLVHTSRIPTAEETGWQINGAGHHFHLSYGFGVMDAAKMVAKAQQWKLVGPQRIQTFISTKVPRKLKCNENVTLTVSTDDYHAFGSSALDHLEHVVTTVDIIHPLRKYLTVYLESPSGTVSQQLTQRPLDDRNKGIRMWNFMSVHFWDENPSGHWNLIISDHTPCKGKIGQINFLGLTFYGTYRGARDRTLRSEKRAFFPSYRTVEQIMMTELLESKSIRTV